MRKMKTRIMRVQEKLLPIKEYNCLQDWLLRLIANEADFYRGRLLSRQFLRRQVVKRPLLTSRVISNELRLTLKLVVK